MKKQIVILFLSITPFLSKSQIQDFYPIPIGDQILASLFETAPDFGMAASSFEGGSSLFLSSIIK